MSTMSSREKSMLVIAGVAVLYAIAALSYKTQTANWRREARIYQGAQKKAAEEAALIAARGEWEARYEQMCDLMPVFPYEQDVATHWLNIMERASSDTGLTIARRQVGKESEVGDVYELPIDCRDWEGTLESLVKFLYDLQKAGAMLDVRQLFVRPSNRPGYLKGTFVLTCAYMRGDEARLGRTAQPPALQELEGDHPAPQDESGAARPEDVAPDSLEEAPEVPQPAPPEPGIAGEEAGGATDPE